MKKNPEAYRGYVEGFVARTDEEMACRYSGLSQRKVGEYYGYKGNGSVLKQRQSLKELLIEDKKLQKRLTKVEQVLLKG